MVLEIVATIIKTQQSQRLIKTKINFLFIYYQSQVLCFQCVGHLRTHVFLDVALSSCSLWSPGSEPGGWERERAGRSDCTWKVARVRPRGDALPFCPHLFG